MSAADDPTGSPPATGSGNAAPPPIVSGRSSSGSSRTSRARAWQHATSSRISSADHVITVSPSRRTSRQSSSGSLHATAVVAAAAAAAAAGPGSTTDLEAGDSSVAGTVTPGSVSSGGASPLARNGAAGPYAGGAALLPPLAPPSAAVSAAVSAAAAAAARSKRSAAGDGLLEPLLPGGDEASGSDPFPATTAARAAAAQVAHFRALQKSAGDLRSQLVAQQSEASAAAAGAASLQRRLDFAFALSWVVNILLLVSKLYAYYLSHSKAVLASAADSAVDLVSQVVISYAEWRMRKEDPRFPVGQARLEAIGVLACACIMSVASFEVVQESVIVILHTLQTGEPPALELGLIMYLVLGSATGLKLLCWAVCAALQAKSDSMLALAEDHLNDIMSNVCAIITAVAAGAVSGGWWIDPAGAIAISLYIVARWLAIAKQQVDKIVGRGAPAAFLQHLEELATSHHQDMGLDVIRAYHFGARYIVELEVLLPASMTVQESHDISLELQHKVEQLEEVERAFVHVDYSRRDGLEHKVERELAIARALSTGSSGRLASTPDAWAGSGGERSGHGGGGSGHGGGSGSGALSSRDTV